MSDQQAASTPVDPLEQWIELRDVYMKSWAKIMGETVNSEAYAKSNGSMLEIITAMTPFRDAQQKAMLSALEQLNMPSRADFISLAGRLANLELLLDNMDAKLSQIHQLATDAASRPAPEAKPEPKSQQVAPEVKAETKAHQATANAVLNFTPEAKLETKSQQPATNAAPKSAPEAKSEAKSSRIPTKNAKSGSR